MKNILIVTVDAVIVAAGMLYISMVLPNGAAPFEGSYLAFSRRELEDLETRTFFWVVVGVFAALFALFLLNSKRLYYVGDPRSPLRAALALGAVVGVNAAYLAIPWWLAADALENHGFPVGPVALLNAIYLLGAAIVLALGVGVGLRKASYQDGRP